MPRYQVSQHASQLCFPAAPLTMAVAVVSRQEMAIQLAKRGERRVVPERIRSAFCRYGDGTMRMTVEQNILFPNIPEDKLDEMRQVRFWPA